MEEYGTGSRGLGVQLLQLGLLRAGFELGEANGEFTEETETALKSFQRKVNLPETGRSDPAVWQALMPWLIGSIFYRIQEGDSYWRLSQRFDTSVSALQTANPELDPNNLRVGQTVVVPLGYAVVPTDIPFTSTVLELCLTGLQLRYPFLRVGAIGNSVMGKPLRAVAVGEGQTQVFYNASHHANEWITTPVLMTFLEQYCLSLMGRNTLYGYDPWELYRRTTLSLVPMVNPDGVDLVTGALTDGPYYEQARRWAQNYPAVSFPEGWKANIAGVDLNLQYPAEWEEAKRIKESMGYISPAPRDYVGTAPLTQPESLAVYQFTLQNNFRLTLSYHSQGQIIYWKFLDYLPPRSRAIADAMGEASGYSVEETPTASGYAGYKDWFIQTYNRPGYTIEVGQGQSPLPLSQFGEIFADNLGILVLGLALAGTPPIRPVERLC